MKSTTDLRGDEAVSVPALTVRGMGELSDLQRAVLDLERTWWRRQGAKETAIRDWLGLTPTRYYQILNGLLDDPAAAAYDGPLVARLRRVRDTRQRRARPVTIAV